MVEDFRAKYHYSQRLPLLFFMSDDEITKALKEIAAALKLIEATMDKLIREIKK